MELVGITLLVSQVLLQYKNKNKGQCMVVVEQEDAQVYVGNRLMKQSSPVLIPVILNKTYHLVIKKQGYEDHHVDLVSRQKTTYYYANLAQVKLHLVR